MDLFMPGRICLFGEHSDWAGSYRRINSAIEPGRCVITGTNQGIRARVQPHPTHLVVTADLGGAERVGPHSIPMDPQALRAEAQGGGPFAYVAGVACQILTHHHVQGLVIDNTETDLPVRKGLASSAAICVLTARAFNRVYDLKLTRRGEMEAAYRGELTTPSRCGRMDQGCAFGQRPVLMTFDADLVEVEPLRIGGPIHMLIVDLGRGKDTRRILHDLNACFPFAESPEERAVHEYLGPINARTVAEAVGAIEAGDAEALGRLMTEAQSGFDVHLAPHSLEELAAPKLHEVLAYGPIQGLVWGGKGVGSGGDGAAQVVARNAEDRREVAEVLKRDLGLDSLPLDLAPPRRIRKAVVPAAGFGTRMFPASKAVKKELAPIVDRDGLAKPVVQVVVEEAVRAGIEEIALVIQPGDRPLFEAFFRSPLSPQHYNGLPTDLREHARYLRTLGRRVTFVFQEEPEGFGDAVLRAREWVGGEPFLLMLGDHVYRSDADEPCAAQVVSAHEGTGGSVLGLCVTPEEEVSNFGVASGVWEEGGARLAVTELAEKPSLEYARSRLRVEGVEDGFLSFFGLYALEAAVFDHLQRLRDANLRRGGEFQLTDALEMLRREEGCWGVLVAGERYDTGRPDAYARAVAAFAPGRPDPSRRRSRPKAPAASPPSRAGRPA